MSILYIVATPIGNLEDISFRAVRILKEVDLILSEDTRVTKKLLRHYKIKTPVLSYHQHSKLKKENYILELLKKDKKLALVSDAGTPGISDPGNKLIDFLVVKLKIGLKIIPIPGPSALTTAVSISGFPTDRFVFMGFPPVKRKRKIFFEKIVNSKYPVIFYESPYRILKSLGDLDEADIKQNSKRSQKVVVCRELTKKFETIYRGMVVEIIKQIENGSQKGEFVVITSSLKN